jgi:hypothetical protein
MGGRTHGALLSLVELAGYAAVRLEIDDLGVVLQLVEAAVGHHVAGVDALDLRSCPPSVTPGLMLRMCATLSF